MMALENQERLHGLKTQVNELQQSNAILNKGNTPLKNSQQLKETRNGDTADLKRDLNQVNLSVNDQDPSTSKNDPKEKHYLLNEPETVKGLAISEAHAV